MKTLRQNATKLANTVATVAGLLIITLMLSQFLIVLLRYLFAIGFSWGLDLLSYLFMIASLLPLLLVVLENRSLRIDIFYQNRTRSSKALLDRIGLLFLLLPVCAYISYTSWPALLNSWQLLEASPTLGGLPGYYLLKTLQLVSFAGLSLVAIILMFAREPWDYDELPSPRADQS